MGKIRFKYTLYSYCKTSYSLINYIVFSQAIRYYFYISRSSYFKFIKQSSGQGYNAAHY